jgi:hypothetical protein
MGVFDKMPYSDEVELAATSAKISTGRRSKLRGFGVGLILLSCLGVAGAVATTYTFVCDMSPGACGSYYQHSVTVTVTNETFNSACGTLFLNSACSNLPWWGTGSYASAWAAKLGFQSDTPQFYYSTVLGLTYSAYQVQGSGQQPTQLLDITLLSTPQNFVTDVQDNGPVPEMDQGALPKVMLLLVLLFLLAQSRARFL